MFLNIIRKFMLKVKIKSVLEGGTPLLFRAMLLPQVVCTLLMCNQVVDGWSPVIFTFVLTPGIPDQFSLHDISHKAGCCQHLLYLHRRVLPTNLGFRCEVRLELPTPWLVRIVVSLSTPWIWNLSKQHPQGEARMMYSLLYIPPPLTPPPRDSPLLSFFLNSTSGLFSKTTFLQLPGTLRHKIRTKLTLQCLAFLYLHQGEGSSFIFPFYIYS